MGLRELKKAQTRQSISDTGLGLFFEKGFANVTTAEIAAASGVSPATLFNYFPTKESIAFDREDEIEQELLEAVRSEKPVLESLHAKLSKSQFFNPPNKRDYARFMTLVRTTPELTAHFHAIWQRYAMALAKALQPRLPKSEAEILARLVVECIALSCQSPNPKETLSLSFKLLKNGHSK